METALLTLWNIFTSSLGIALVWIGVFAAGLFLLDLYFPLRKAWEKHEGTIITGIKLAEKAIPDDTPNAGLLRLDEALRFVLAAYAEQNHGSHPSPDLQRELKEGIQIKHAELERLGNLPRSRK